MQSGLTWNGIFSAQRMPRKGERHEAVAKRADGSEFPAELVINAIEISGGKLFTLYFRDISIRLAADARLRTLSHAVEQSSAAILITDTDGTIEYVNPAFTRVTGYGAEEAVGENPRILKSYGNSPEVYRELWETVNQGETWHGELLNVKKNGELYWEHGSISPIRDGQGHVTHYVGVKEDVTDRKRTEEELRRYSTILCAVADISTMLLRAESWEEKIGDILAKLGEATEASRVFVFENNEGEGGQPLCSQRHEWRADGTLPNASGRRRTASLSSSGGRRT